MKFSEKNYLIGQSLFASISLALANFSGKSTSLDNLFIDDFNRMIGTLD